MNKRRARTIVITCVAGATVVGMAVVAGSEDSEPENTVRDDFQMLECAAPMMVERILDYGPEAADPRASTDIDEAIDAWVADVYYDAPAVPASVDLAPLPTPIAVSETARWGLRENGQLKAVLYFGQAPSGRWRLGRHVACGDWLATHDHFTQDVPQ